MIDMYLIHQTVVPMTQIPPVLSPFLNTSALESIKSTKHNIEKKSKPSHYSNVHFNTKKWSSYTK